MHSGENFFPERIAPPNQQLPVGQFLFSLLQEFAVMNTENKDQQLPEPDAVEQSGGGNPASAQVSEALEEHRLTPEEIEELKDQASKAEEHWQQMLRVAADFENFKKRAARERQDISKYANESLLQKLIPVLDSFDMALAAASSAQTNTLQQLQAGI